MEKLLPRTYFQRKLTKVNFSNFLSNFHEDHKFKYDPIVYFIQKFIPNSKIISYNYIKQNKIHYYYIDDNLSAYIDVGDDQMEQYYDLPTWISQYSEIYEAITAQKRKGIITVKNAMHILDLIN